MARPTLPKGILVMGVSGAGKSTLGRALAERAGYAFIEGDELHPPANIRKMAAGTALNDDDRWPWLERIAQALEAAALANGGVVACSALKRRYRDLIRARLTIPLAIIWPVVARYALTERLAERKGHYMPASLLDSQLDALEPPQADEAAIRIDVLPVDQQVEIAIRRLAVDPAKPEYGQLTQRNITSVKNVSGHISPYHLPLRRRTF